MNIIKYTSRNVKLNGVSSRHTESSTYAHTCTYTCMHMHMHTDSTNTTLSHTITEYFIQSL